MSENDKTRREMMKVTGGTFAGVGFSGTVLAENGKSSGNDKNGKKRIDVEMPEIAVLAEDSSSVLYKVEYANKVSVYQIEESKGGKVTKTSVGNAEEVRSISAVDTETVTVQKDDSQTTDVEQTNVTTQGWSVVDRFSGVNSRIGDCKTDSGYRHLYTGITFSLTRSADVIGKETLTETIGVLVGYILGSGVVAGALSALAGIAAGAILNLFTGRHYTVAAKDGFIDWNAGYSPQINGVVANSYDASVSSTTDVASIPDAHLGGEHEIENVSDNPWVK